VRGTDRSIGVYFFWPETANRHLEEVDQIFRESSNIFQTVKVARMLPQASLIEHERHEKEQVRGEHVEAASMKALE